MFYLTTKRASNDNEQLSFYSQERRIYWSDIRVLLERVACSKKQLLASNYTRAYTYYLRGSCFY